MLLAALLLQIAPPVLQGKHEPIKDWKYQRKELNPKTGVEEVAAEIAGEEATPIELTRGREVFEVRGVKAVYYLTPRPPRSDKVERVEMSARRARMDNAAGILRLQDAVRVVRPGPTPADPPSILTAPEAVVTFRPEFLCSVCGQRGAAKGDCPLCRKPLSERMSIAVQASRDFELAGPEGTIRGEGLAADEAMTDIAVERHGFLEVVGDPQDLARAPALRSSTPRRVIHQLACRGPLRIRETRPGRRLVDARDGVRLDRIDETGTQTALADRMSIALGSRLDPSTLKSVPVVERIDADGDVRLGSVTFLDGRELTARAASMRVERADFDDFQTTAVLLTGSPAELLSGATSIRAPRISLDQPFGAALFEEGVDARVAGLGAADAPPVLLRARTLAARLNALANDVESLEATGDVFLEGLLAGSGGGRASAERFLWDRASGNGRLESPRLVRVEQGATLVLAPVVTLRDAGRSVVLQGPKRIVFVQERDGRREELAASCEGDILYDAQAGRMTMSHRCLLRTPEFRLSADRVDVTLDPVKRELAGFTARGDVRAWRAAENILLSGNRLLYDPARQEFRLRGAPHAMASRERATMTCEEIVLIERTDAAGNRIPVTELRGGAQGVRIVIPGELR